MSNQIVYQVLKHLAIALYPEDITFINDSKKYTIKEFMESQQLREKLIPGDLVLTQTPGPIHATIRNLAHFRYDHLVEFFLNPYLIIIKAIIIDDENMLHIAPPYIRLLSSNILLMKKRNPLVIRINLTPEERKKTIKILLQAIGERYDYARVLGLSVRVFASKMLNIVKTEKKSILDQGESNICSDLIAYILMKSSPAFKAVVRKHFKHLDIAQYESFSPDDFCRLAELDNHMVVKIHESFPINSYDPGKKLDARELITKVTNSLFLYKRVTSNIKREKINDKTGKLLVLFKYLFIHDFIPYEKELLLKFIPVNKRFIEFILVLLQIRQYYYDTILEQPTEVIKKLFPTFFLVASKFLGHGELDIILKQLTAIKKNKPTYGPKSMLLNALNLNKSIQMEKPKL